MPLTHIKGMREWLAWASLAGASGSPMPPVLVWPPIMEEVAGGRYFVRTDYDPGMTTRS